MPYRNAAPPTTGLLVAFLASGCTVYATSSTQTSSAQVETGAASGPRSPGDAAAQRSGGVTVVETTCGAVETCNGLDDDCNGVIDEGCGYDTGVIQVTLGWSSGVDLDLYVVDPQGQTLSYQRTSTTTGGRLDRDARGLCGGQDAGTTENVFWAAGSNPPSGAYRVEVHYWGDCNTGLPVTTANLSIAADGRVIGAYAVELGRGQRVPVASFTIQ